MAFLFQNCNYIFTFQKPSERKNVYCFYKTSNSLWLRLGPMKIEIKSQDMVNVVIKDLLYSKECEQIVKSNTSNRCTKLQPAVANRLAA